MLVFVTTCREIHDSKTNSNQHDRRQTLGFDKRKKKHKTNPCSSRGHANVILRTAQTDSTQHEHTAHPRLRKPTSGSTELALKRCPSMPPLHRWIPFPSPLIPLFPSAYPSIAPQRRAPMMNDQIACLLIHARVKRQKEKRNRRFVSQREER
ncbi:hypothetical protein VTJ04DRAFT_8506 [Mycothermus thermophilus]|uniref:uncharacterized protein n=1 Tax=Humicola insolens TaxID=85995 RepID=UPI003742CE8E